MITQLSSPQLVPVDYMAQQTDKSQSAHAQTLFMYINIG